MYEEDIDVILERAEVVDSRPPQYPEGGSAPAPTEDPAG